MLSKFLFKMCAVSALILMVSPATSEAGWFSVGGAVSIAEGTTGGTVGNHLVHPPTETGDNISATAPFFVNELQNHLLAAPLMLDVGPAAPFIPAGVMINSYLFYAQDASPSLTLLSFDLGFTTKIAGLQRLGSTLATADGILGDGGSYPSALVGRQLEFNDTSVIQPDGKTLFNNWRVFNQMDSIRVITFAPEPSTYLMLGGTLCLALYLMRRRMKKTV